MRESQVEGSEGNRVGLGLTGHLKEVALQCENNLQRNVYTITNLKKKQLTHRNLNVTWFPEGMSSEAKRRGSLSNY